MVNFSQFLLGRANSNETDIENCFFDANLQESEFLEFFDSLVAIPYWKNAQDYQGHYKKACRILSKAVDDFAKSNAKEPPYHSRSHFKDVCLGVSILLQDQDSDDVSSFGFKDDDAWILLLSAIGHDFGHNGSVNGYPFELELQSIEYVKRILLASELPTSFGNKLIDRMRPIILATDPTCIKKVFNAYSDGEKNTTFSLDDYLSVLIIEADLMGSTLPTYGEKLTQKLSKEWLVENSDQAIFITTTKGRLNFLNSFQFISPAAQRIGLEVMRKKIARKLKEII